MAGDDTFLFTSESVNEGHPDKLADQVRAAQQWAAVLGPRAGQCAPGEGPCRRTRGPSGPHTDRTRS
jgi:hypothetical protein